MNGLSRKRGFFLVIIGALMWGVGGTVCIIGMIVLLALNQKSSAKTKEKSSKLAPSS